MAQFYSNVTGYVYQTRTELQDLVEPYRYIDDQIVDALNSAMLETGRIRPDIFLDLKYQNPLRKGDLDEGQPPIYSIVDVGYLSDGITYDMSKGTTVPIPSKYIMPVIWFMSGWLQKYDMEDTQDQRAMAFLMKFEKSLLSAV